MSYDPFQNLIDKEDVEFNLSFGVLGDFINDPNQDLMDKRYRMYNNGSCIGYVQEDVIIELISDGTIVRQKKHPYYLLWWQVSDELNTGFKLIVKKHHDEKEQA